MFSVYLKDNLMQIARKKNVEPTHVSYKLAHDDVMKCQILVI